MHPIAAQATQVLVAGLGGALFHWLGVPAAWLSGAVVAVVLWGVLGQARPLSGPLVDLGMLLSGASMGAGITPEALQAVARYPVSMGLLALAVLAITGASSLYLVRVSGWSRDDALLASVPGALTTVMAVAADRGARIGVIAVVQSFRLLVLLTVLPSLVVWLGGGRQVAGLIGAGQPVAGPLGLAVILAAGLVLGAILKALRVAAPVLLGATLASAVVHAGDVVPGVVAPPIATLGLVLVGVYIAERFRTLDPIALLKALPAALGAFLVGMAVALAFAALAAALSGIGFADALVAFAPGGLEAMMVLALVLGLDPLYVGVHHLARFLAIGFGLPLIMRRPRDP